MSHFGEIITALGATELREKSKSEHWELAEAVFETPAGNVSATYLYLKSKCPWAEATPRNLSDWSANSGAAGYKVVLAPSSTLSGDLDRVQRVFRGVKAQTTRDLLLESFARQLKASGAEQFDDSYFIDPDLTLADNTTIPNASSYLAQWLNTHPSKEGQQPSIAVVVADGGVGKTTLARVLSTRIANQNKTAFPVLVESGMWRDVIQSNVQLKTIIERAIAKRYVHAARLTSSEDALRALFRSGVFVLIFDGFDELCVHPGSTVSPKQILEELAELSKIEDEGFQSRILVTTRESYWQSIQTEVDSSQLEIFKIRGFDNEKKKTYFQKRLKSAAARDLALRLAKQISGAMFGRVTPEAETSDRPSGVPFILDLIARYIEDNGEAQPLNPYEADPLGTLLEGICRRENLRQRLGIDPYKQLELFEELFREYEDKITHGDLATFAEVLCNVRDKDTLARLTNHVFFTNAGPQLLAARYEVLRVYFVARFLSKGLLQAESEASRAKIARLLAAQSAGRTQVIEWLVDQLRRQSRDRLLDAVQKAHEIVLEQADVGERQSAQIALTHLAAALVEDQKTRADRTGAVAELFGISMNKNGQFVWRRLAFGGVVSNLDLSTVTFEECVFNNVTFTKCRFSTSTVFASGEFVGDLSFAGCENVGDLKVTDKCLLSKEAEYELARVHNDTARREVRVSLAEDAAVRALRRFKTEVGFVPGQARRMGNGFRPGNPYNQKIWDTLFSAGIVERHTISGVTEGGLNVVNDKEVRKEILDFLDNGVLGGRLRGAINQMVD